MDEFEQTNIQNIFAIGDILDGKLQLTPVAIQAGKLLARRLFAGAKGKVFEPLPGFLANDTGYFVPLARPDSWKSQQEQGLQFILLIWLFIGNNGFCYCSCFY